MHTRHQAKRHTSRMQFTDRIYLLPIREIMSSISKTKLATFRIKNCEEASYEHIGGNIRVEKIVYSRQHFTWRSVHLSGSAEHTTCSSHHQSSRHAFVGNVPYD